MIRYYPLATSLKPQFAPRCCSECTAQFEPRDRFQRTCSPRCSRKRNQRLQTERRRAA